MQARITSPGGVFVYEQPDESARVLRSFEYGQELDVELIDRDWVRVLHPVYVLRECMTIRDPNARPTVTEIPFIPAPALYEGEGSEPCARMWLSANGIEARLEPEPMNSTALVAYLKGKGLNVVEVDTVNAPFPHMALLTTKGLSKRFLPRSYQRALWVIALDMTTTHFTVHIPTFLEHGAFVRVPLTDYLSSHSGITIQLAEPGLD